MVMRIETDAELFGYATLAVVLSVLASGACFGLVITSILTDLPQRRRNRRR